MRETVLALYDDLETAQAAVRELVTAGYDRSSIGLAVNDAEGRYSRQAHSDAADVAVSRLEDEDVSGSEGASFGAVIGGLTGIVAGLTAITIPGIGPIIAAGPLAAVLGGATGGVIGAAAGAVTGGITASLIEMGVPDNEADYYAESLRRGSALVTVTVHEDQVDRVINILRDHNPFDIEQRVTQWRMHGWRGFDPKADPYTAVDLAKEREASGTVSAINDAPAAWNNNLDDTDRAATQADMAAREGADVKQTSQSYTVRRYRYRGEENR